jgi:hypothetical protein
MKLYLCKWPDDTGKIVACRNRQELFWALDFEGDPYCAQFKELKRELSINFGFEVESDADGDHRYTKLRDYDEDSGDFIREAFDSGEGWKSFKTYFPYASGTTNDPGAGAACDLLDWNPEVGAPKN